jgi:hypothetical protein
MRPRGRFHQELSYVAPALHFRHDLTSALVAIAVAGIAGVSVMLAVALPFGSASSPQVSTVESAVAVPPQPAPSLAATPEPAPLAVAETAPALASAAAAATDVKRSAAVQRKRQNRKQYAAWGRDYYQRYARSYSQRSPASW